MAPPASSNPVRGRGRPRVAWTPHRQRRLLRLYLCTPESELPLRSILELLNDHDFRPRYFAKICWSRWTALTQYSLRAAQVELKRLLSEDYRRLRPMNTASSHRRVACLKSVGFRSKPKRSSLVHPPEQQRTYVPHPCPHDRYGLPVNIKERNLANPTTTTQPHVPDSIAPSREQNRKSRLRRVLPSNRSSHLPAEIASLRSLSARSSLRTSLCSSLRSGLLRSSLISVTPSENEHNFWRKLVTRAEASPDPRWDTPDFEPQLETVQDHEEYESSKAATDAVLAHCCGASNGNLTPEEAQCIHLRLLNTIRTRTRLQRSVVTKLTMHDITDTDQLGNCLLHTAARWGVHIATIAKIVERLPLGAAADVLNTKRETFLHVLDPKAVTSAEDFAALVYLLRAKEFDFCQLDCSGRTFVTRLLRRSGFPWKALVYLLETAPQEDLLHWSSPQRSSSHEGHVLLRDILEKQRRESGQALGLALHCQYLLQKGLLGQDSGPIKIISGAFTGEFMDVMGPTTANIGMTGKLHRLIGTMNGQDNLGTRYFQISPTESFEFVDALQYALKRTFTSDMIDLDTGQSPLMTLLVGFSCATAQSRGPVIQPTDPMQEQCVKLLLDSGASLDTVDFDGNTALHYAAALGLNPALKIFVQRNGDLKRQNNHGFTPAQVAASSMRYGKATNPQSVSRTAQLYESISILHK